MPLHPADAVLGPSFFHDLAMPLALLSNPCADRAGGAALIALQFKKAFPHNFEYYRHCCKTGAMRIGHLVCVEETSLLYGTKLVINFPTKTHWRKPSDYDYIDAGLIALTKAIRQYAITSIALPPLGCGNGKLDWQIVKPMMEKHLSGVAAIINIYEPIYE